MRCDRGQSTVELILVLPVVVLAMLAVVQVGLIGRDQLLVWHAAREAARAAAVNPSAAAARTAATSAAPPLSPHRLTVDLHQSGSGGGGTLVATTITYRAPTEVPLVGQAVGDLTLRATVTMRVEP